MPTRKTISEVYKTHVTAFTKSLLKAKSLKEKEVHSLRVEIKNLRVLINLLDELTKKKLPIRPILKMLEPIFTSAGKIRTHHLNIHLVRTYEQPFMSRFSMHLKTKEYKAGKKLIRTIKRFDLEKFERLQKDLYKAFGTLRTGTIKTESEKYLKNAYTKLKNDIPNSRFNKVMHDIRKNLKTIRNIERLLSELGLKDPFQNKAKTLSQAYETIGRWHDGIILVNVLKNYLEKHEKLAELEEALPFLVSLFEKNEKSKLAISKKLKAGLI